MNTTLNQADSADNPSSALQFHFGSSSVRCIQETPEALFAGRDVASILGYTNPAKALKDHCKGVTKRSILSNGGIQEMLFIPERDVYRLIMRSKLPAAEKFEEWVVAEVLPAIRRTGGYVLSEVPPLEPPPQFQIPSNFAAALQLAADQARQLEEAQPKLETYDKVMSADGLFGFREVAAMINQPGLGSNNLVKRLLELRVLFRDSRHHLLCYREYLESGYFKAIESPYELKQTGEMRVSCNLKVTARGVEWIITKLGLTKALLGVALPL